MLIKNLKDEIQELLDISASLLSLVYAGHILQEKFTVQHYGIVRDSTIFLSMTLRGGSFGSSSKGTGSFKDAVKGKGEATNKPTPTQDLLGPYIVEQRKKTPVLTIDLPEVLGEVAIGPKSLSCPPKDTSETTNAIFIVCMYI